MLEFHNDNRTKPWLKRAELENLDHDPNVLDMIKAVQPLMGPLQEKLDKVLYPNVAQDAATVREMIGRFEGREGMYFLQTGPGFTRRNEPRRKCRLSRKFYTSPTPMSLMRTQTTAQLLSMVTTSASALAVAAP